MTFRKDPHFGRSLLAVSWVALLAYGCSEAADNPPLGSNGGTAPVGGTNAAGTGVGGTGTAGTGMGGTGTAGTGVGGTGTAGTGTAGTGTAGTGVGGDGTAGTGMGGTGVAGTGVGGDGTAGTGVAGTGTAGTGTAGAGGSGTAGATSSPECSGIRSNMACVAPAVAGTVCDNMACGLGDSGRRVCNCTAETTWMCTSCDFTNSWIRDMPASIPACDTAVVDGTACAAGIDSPTSLCAAPTGAEDPFCVCASDPRNAANPPEWNCDSAPSTWGAASQ